MRTRAPLIALVCAAFAVVPANASADFVPELAIGLDPATAGAAPTLTATIGQPAADTAVERFTISLPAGFTAYGAPNASNCPLAAIRSGSCPASSQIGTVNGSIGPVISFSGTVHKFRYDRFAVFISGLGGVITQALGGAVTARDGGLDLTLNGLPDLPVTSLVIRLDGGGRALVRNPADCGAYAIDGKFTSRDDELALARSLVSITGCSGVPAVSVTNLRMSKTRFRVGRQTVIAWSASRATDHTNVRIERKVKGKWRVVGVLVATGKQGENILRWGGRIGERELKPGRYAVRIQPAGSAPAKPPLEFEVLG